MYKLKAQAHELCAASKGQTEHKLEPEDAELKWGFVRSLLWKLPHYFS